LPDLDDNDCFDTSQPGHTAESVADFSDSYPRYASADPILPQPGQEATYRLMLGILVENDLLAMRFEDDRIAQRATSHEFLLARP
jgi:hypothetical protein